MSISFKQYIEEFNHTHKFSKEFLDKIFDYAEKICSGYIVMGNYPPATTAAHLITYITDRLTSPLYINIPLLEFFAKTSQTSSIHYDCVRVFMVKCANKNQLFIDKELLHNQLTQAHLFGLNEVIYNMLVYNESVEMVEYICNQLLQTDIGKQNIIDLYNYSISKNSDITANAIFPYAQKALATDNITADDIKDLFDI